LSTRPIAVRCGSHIDRWRGIVAWGGGCGPDNRSYGKSTYEPRAQISVPCTSWESRGTGEQAWAKRRSSRGFVIVFVTLGGYSHCSLSPEQINGIKLPVMCNWGCDRRHTRFCDLQQ